MKKKGIILMLVTLILTVAYTVVYVSAEPISTPLVADGGEWYEDPGRYGLVIGSVDVYNNISHLIVTFTITEDDWYLNETHLAVSDNVGGIPQTKKGNPKPGHFEYSGEHMPGVKTYVYEIPFSGLVHDGTVTVAAHAEVTNMDDIVYIDPETGEFFYREESAWGEGTSFRGRNWAMFFEYTMQLL